MNRIFSLLVNPTLLPARIRYALVRRLPRIRFTLRKWFCKPNTVHLCIICGCENPFELVRHTVSHSLPVFNTIHIVDTGSTDRTRELQSWSSKINYIEWNRWHRGWSDAVETVRHDVPAGHWFIYLESNETPTQTMLDNIHSEIKRIQTAGYGQASLPGMLHINGKRMASSPETMTGPAEKSNPQEAASMTGVYRNGPWLELQSGGSDLRFVHHKLPSTRLRLNYCQHRNTDNYHANRCIQSIFPRASWGVPRDRTAYDVLHKFTDLACINNPGDLMRFMSSNPPGKIIDQIKTWQHSDLESCEHWYKWYEKKFEVGDYPLSLCDEDCCNYDDDTRTDATVHAESVPKYIGDWTFKQVDGQFFVHSVDRMQAFKISGPGAEMAMHIDGFTSIAEIVNSSIDGNSEPEKNLLGYSFEVVRDLVSRGVLVVTREKSVVDFPGTQEAILRAVDQELRYWKNHGGWDARMLASEALKRNWIVVSFDRGKTRIDMNGHEKARCGKLAPYLQWAAIQAPDLNVVIAIDPGDGPRGHPEFPVLGFSKYCVGNETLILMPDIYFINGYNHIRKRIKIAEDRLSWDDKLPVSIWRGSSTGRANNKENWRENLRVKLCLYGQNCPDIVDARLTSFAQSTEEVIQLMQQYSLKAKYIREEEQLRYKYLLNVDGNSSSWGGTYWKLLSNSLMIQVCSERIGNSPGSPRGEFKGYRQWYHHWLEEGQHYISSTLDELTSTIEWARNNDKECRKVAENATSFVARFLSFDAGRVYFTELLRALSVIQNSSSRENGID